MPDLQQIGEDLNKALHEHCPEQDGGDNAALCVAEEAGELVGAYRRWAGQARRPGTLAELEAEVADVLITTAIFAARIGIGIEDAVNAKLEKIYSRGWKA